MEPEIIGNRIKELMKKNKITVKELSDSMHIDIKELNEKLEGKEEFYIDEMKKIKEIFELDEKASDDLFFQEHCKI